MGGVTFVVSGMCCAGGVLKGFDEIEKIGREQSRLFFVVGMGGSMERESFKPLSVTLLTGLFLPFESLRNYLLMCQVKPLDSYF